MHECQCEKSVNGYYQWQCVTDKCMECKNIKPPVLECSNSNELVTFSQFEVCKVTYKTKDKSTLMLLSTTNEH